MKNKKSIQKAFSFLMFCLFFVAVSASAFAQQKAVSGKVVDDNGEALPGVTVVVKGTSTGTVTDIDGNFSLSNVTSESVLTISFVGMLTQEIAVGSQTSIDVTLKTDAVGLEEVVVVGYGTQSKATLTGAVVQVKGEEMIKGKGTSSVALAMQGEIPGLVVTRSSSRPGNEGLDIKIRGDYSVNGISPLVLIDGVEAPEWMLSTINSSDIESLSVLKDGAAAIYGSKAAGGVILVTTKKGQKGKIKVEYRGDVQFNYAYKMPLANFKELADIWLQGGRNDMIDYVDTDGNPQTAAFTGRFFSEDYWQQISDGTFPLAPETVFLFGSDHRFADESYYDYVFGTTMSHRHNVSFSGGNENATYRTSLGYANDRSPMELVYDGAKKYNFRTNLSYKVNDMIQTDFMISYDNRIIDAPTHGVGEGLQNPQFYPIKNPQGQYYTLWADHVPLELEEGGRTVEDVDIIRLSGALNLNMDKYLQGLSFMYKGDVTKRNHEKTARTKMVTKYDWDGNPSTYAPARRAVSQVDVYIDNIFFQNHLLQGNYKRSFGEHNVSAMLGITWEEQEATGYDMQRKYLLSDELDALNTGDASTMTNAGTAWHESLFSYISRLNYDYNGIYLAEFAARRDGSSRFHPDYRWKNFYYGSAGIRLSELGFLKDGFFQNLKLRASYGETGSRVGIGRYDYISTMSSGETYFGTTPAIYNTYRISSMTSTERTWERVAKTDIGVDFAVLDSRLSGSMDYFIHNNDDMLVSITYPEILGASAPKTNSGAFESKGWEISLNWRDKIGELSYQVGAALWDSKGEVTHMEGAETIGRGLNTSPIEGYPLNSIWVYKTDGIFDNEADILAYYEKYGFDGGDQTTTKPGSILPAYRSANRLVPGTVNRVDVSDDGLINQDDLVFHGDANPHYAFSFNFGLQYKGFDFSAFFQGVGQQYIQRNGTLAYPFRSWWMNQNSVYASGDLTWSPENTGAELPMIFYNGSRKNWNYGHPNDLNIINARYIRAKVISLGYTIPQTITTKAGMDRVRVSVTGNDLFTISNVKDGLDPEHGRNAHNGNQYPYNSALMFSLELTF
ncbi:SusC/RagA family TonB-linked outer membrane protein [uncultured Draconibacterium sp.]|uniref:SusC/RagA family TonB-linked outer membrane protein n=1 Tax=uncultured Draconibacterium sp. TaxID=1573823 RepID=UPI0025E24E23|nr:SusC/RagA family TonB-linked outer membrane protein [uncultured Draconibacterium sp.]